MLGDIAVILGVLIAPALFGFLLTVSLYDSTVSALNAAGVRKGAAIWQLRANPRSTFITMLAIPFLAYMVYSQF